MSCYEDIYNDFPLRCASVWENLAGAAAAQDLDVTFMLMVAAAGFATPWEHLKIQPGQAKDNKNHPAFLHFDEKPYQRSLSMVDKALKASFQDSPLFCYASAGKWFYGHAQTIGAIRQMAESHSPRQGKIEDLTARSVVKILRNAIAHNNLYAFARDKSKVISELAFFSEVVDKSKGSGGAKQVLHYEVLALPVDDFRQFLTAWFALLNRAQPHGKQLKLVVATALEGDGDRLAA